MPENFCLVCKKFARKFAYISYEHKLLEQAVKALKNLAVLLCHLQYALFQLFVLKLRCNGAALGLKILLVSQCVLNLHEFLAGHGSSPPLVVCATAAKLYP